MLAAGEDRLSGPRHQSLPAPRLDRTHHRSRLSSPSVVGLPGGLGTDKTMRDSPRQLVGVETLYHVARPQKPANLPSVAVIRGHDAYFSRPRHGAPCRRHCAAAVHQRPNAASTESGTRTSSKAPHEKAGDRPNLQRLSSRRARPLPRCQRDRHPLSYRIGTGHWFGLRWSIQRPEVQQIFDEILGAMRASGRKPGLVFC